MAELVIVRGFPDSEKKSVALDLEAQGYNWFETDHFLYGKDYVYFDEKGNSKYSKEKVIEGHAWCQNRVRDSLESGHNTVVSNTAIRRWEVLTYVRIARSCGVRFRVIECTNEGYDDYPPSCDAKWLNDARKRWEPWNR